MKVNYQFLQTIIKTMNIVYKTKFSLDMAKKILKYLKGLTEDMKVYEDRLQEFAKEHKLNEGQSIPKELLEGWFKIQNEEMEIEEIEINPGNGEFTPEELDILEAIKPKVKEIPEVEGKIIEPKK